MEKRIGLRRRDNDTAYIVQVCQFWTELGWEVICPPPNTRRSPIVKLWCASEAGAEDLALRIRNGKICTGDLPLISQRTGEALSRLQSVARRCGR